MARTIDLKAAERTRILHMFSDSIPKTIAFGAATTSGAAPTGTIEVVRQGGRSETHALGTDNSVQKGFTDWNFSIYVTPDQDCTVTMPGGLLQGKTLFLIIGLVLLIGLIAGGMAAFVGPPPPPGG